MIRIERNRIDVDSGKIIQPERSWYVLAKKREKKAKKEKKKHRFDRGVFAHQKVRIALEKTFNNKCAYCETSILRMTWDVEHFRPKNSPEERPEHPGYYWLAYDWENLYSSCPLCNQYRKERATWDGAAGTAGGKASRFPVVPESSRACKPSDDIKKEKRRLIDPCADYPEKYFKYNILGEIDVARSPSRSQISIDVFNLVEPRLVEARETRIAELVALLKLRKNTQSKGNNDDVVKEIDDIIECKWVSDTSPYAGACRYVIKNLVEFGL